MNGTVMVTDPCYEPLNGCNQLVHSVLTGNWYCEVRTKNCGAWGKRISSLTIRHANYPKGKIDEYVGSAGVDSGQCGFFDPEYYDKNQPDDDFDNLQSWYRRVCELTLNEPEWGTIENAGVVASSGYGDGCYPIYACRERSGFVVGLKIKFI